METKHHIADLDEMIKGLEERQQLNIATIKEMGRELTKIENTRFEVGWGMLRDQLLDLRKMRDAWSKGYPMYRKTEKMMEEKG